MSDRIVRMAILTSDSVNKLSWSGEVFYRRLMSIVDDFGRYDGRVSVLRANLYPLKLSSVSEPDVEKWLDECSTAALVRRYVVDGKQYLEVLKFNQRLRAMKSKWPAPLSDDSKRQQMTTSAVAFVSVSDSVSASEGGPGETMPETFHQLKAELWTHFRRTDTQKLGYEEEHLLAEISRSPSALDEWNTIRCSGHSFKRQSLLTLLQNWAGELDKARNFKPDPKEQARTGDAADVALRRALKIAERGGAGL